MDTHMMVEIGILGSGNMGRALGVRFAALGHPVFFGGRDPTGSPQQAAALASKSASASKPQSGTLTDAAAFGKILIWTMRETNVESIMGKAMSKMAGKPVIDLNNRDYSENIGKHGGDKDRPFFQMSIAEDLQHHLDVVGAHVIKAFNTLPLEHLALPAEKLRANKAQTFIANLESEGSAAAKDMCIEVIKGLGFEPVDFGSGVTAMRILEVMGDVIRYYLMTSGQGAMMHLAFLKLPNPVAAEMQTIGQRAPSSYK